MTGNPQVGMLWMDERTDKIAVSQEQEENDYFEN
jgi:hypothetical protein